MINDYGPLSDDSIEMFLCELDELEKDDFIEVASAIVSELEERTRYQAIKHNLDLIELLKSIGI